MVPGVSAPWDQNDVIADGWLVGFILAMAVYRLGPLLLRWFPSLLRLVLRCLQFQSPLGYLLQLHWGWPLSPFLLWYRAWLGIWWWDQSGSTLW